MMIKNAIKKGKGYNILFKLSLISIWFLKIANALNNFI